MKKFKLFSFLLVIVFAQEAFTSKEGMLGLSSFQLESKGMDNSGSIVVKGRSDQTGKIESLAVSAFGKDFAIAKEVIDLLPNANGIQLTYEHGWENVGGKTVYVTFLSGFTTSERSRKILVVQEKNPPHLLKNP